MGTSLFPAVIIGGAPNCGKSVLTYLLTQSLRRRDREVMHYVLRAAPDGEGDWFLDGQAASRVHWIRQRHKREFSTAFVHRVCDVLQRRWLPLLVDVGGQPQGEQLRILRACTHVVVLYRSREQLQAWRRLISQTNLQTIAELRSRLAGPGRIEQLHPVLRGTISGLDRANPVPDAVFGVLLERLAGILRYDADHLRAVHYHLAPYPPLDVRNLASELGLRPTSRGLWWEPEILPALVQYLRQHSGARALYGRAPVWLGAAIAAALAPHPLALFDARFGWLPLPQPVHRPSSALSWQVRTLHDAWLISASLSHAWLQPDELSVPSLPDGSGVILDGKLPLWAFVALTRMFQPARDFVAVHDVRRGAAVVVTSRVPTREPGDLIPLNN